MGLNNLTHMNEQGRSRMVDISAKETTNRMAHAKATVVMKPSTLQLIKQAQIGKGDVLGVAQVAGIMAGKRTAEWIPMCHPIPITGLDIRFSDNDDDELYIETIAKTTAQTGVEMEALTAASAAALTVYDMCKAVDKDMVIQSVCLLRKTGGKSGDYTRA